MSRAVVDLGDPDQMERAGRTLRLQAELVRSHARSHAARAADAAQGWKGGAALGFATRSGRHVTSARGAATDLDRLGGKAIASSAVLRRVGNEIRWCTGEIDRLEDELRLELAARSGNMAQLLTAEEMRASQERVVELRRQIAELDRTLGALADKVLHLREEIRTLLESHLPADVVQWWKDGADSWEWVSSWKPVLRDSTWLLATTRGIFAHRAATAAGDAAAAAAARGRLMAAMRHAAPAGDLSDARTSLMTTLRAVADPARAGAMIPPLTNPALAAKAAAATEKVAAVAGSALEKIGAFRQTPLGRQVWRALGPIGIADTAYQGIQDVVTGGGEDGAEGVENRFTGLVQAGGAIAMLFPPTAVAGTTAVLAVTAYKAGRTLWKNREAVTRFFQTTPKVLRSHVPGLGEVKVETGRVVLPEEQAAGGRAERAPASVGRLRGTALAGAAA